MAPETCVDTPNPFGKREPILVDVDQATHLLSLSKSYIYREVKAGRIPHKKIGSRILFRVSELNTWIDNHDPDTQESRCA